MRFLVILAVTLVLSSCELAENDPATPAVDAENLLPLSSKEQALILGAQGAAQQGNFEAAERDYLGAIAASRGQVGAHMALAKLYIKQGANRKAQTILERALALQPTHAEANYLLGKYYLDANAFDAAPSAFQQGRQSAPENGDLAVGEAIANDMLGQHPAAQLHYQRLMKQNTYSHMASVRTNLAMSYLLSGEAKKALALLLPEAKKPNASPVTRHNLALAYGLLGKHSEAKAALKGDIDEETRTLALARLKEYLKARRNNEDVLPPKPMIRAP